MSGSNKGRSIRGRTDLLELSNLRNDGRKPHEIRRMNIQLGIIPDRMGSAFVEMGLTSCIAIVTGPIECIRKSDEVIDRAIVDVTMQISPFATSDRRIFHPNSDRRLIESSMQIQLALEASILLQTYPKSRIAVQLLILSDDGGRICTAINAATLALIDAGIPMKDFCCACSAGTSNNDSATVLIDLNRIEESNTSHGSTTSYMPVAILPQRNTVVFSQFSDSRLPDFDSLEYVLEAAMDGCQMIYKCMQTAVKERATTILSSFNGNTTLAT